MLASEALLGRSPIVYSRCMATASAASSGIDALVSQERLRPYIRAAGDDPGLAQELYEWSSRLSAAAFGVVAQLEVLQRNAIDREMSKYLREVQRGIPWFLMPFGGDHEVVQNAVLTTRLRLRALKKESRHQIVAHLSFGFWTGLVGSKYEELWRSTLHKAFPGAPNGQRKRVAGQIDAIRSFRNRIAHHDSLLNVDVPFEYRRILNVAEWIDPNAKAWLENLSQLMDVYREKPSLAEDTVVVAAGNAWELYESSGTYVCQPGRFFRPVRYVAFYAAGAIQAEIPRVMHRRDDVEWTAAEATRLRSTGDPMDKRIAAAIELADAKIWDGGRYQVFVLTRPGMRDSDHRSLEAIIPNTRGGRGSAYTQRQRYVSLHSLEVASSTDDL